MTKPTEQMTVESDVPATVLRQLHDDAHCSFRSLASRCQTTTDELRALYRRDVAHVPMPLADALYAIQAEIELRSAKLYRRWQF